MAHLPANPEPLSPRPLTRGTTVSLDSRAAPCCPHYTHVEPGGSQGQWVRLPIPHLAGEDPEAEAGEDLLSSHLQHKGGSPSVCPVRRTL